MAGILRLIGSHSCFAYQCDLLAQHCDLDGIPSSEVGNTPAASLFS